MMSEQPHLLCGAVLHAKVLVISIHHHKIKAQEKKKERYIIFEPEYAFLPTPVLINTALKGSILVFCFVTLLMNDTESSVMTDILS